MATLLSVNIGMPKDVSWRGRTVHTGVWKSPVTGRRMVRRLNIDGDGQGDLAGHGGEIRAVLVYQIESYRHWQDVFGLEVVLVKDFVWRSGDQQDLHVGAGSAKGLRQSPTIHLRERDIRDHEMDSAFVISGDPRGFAGHRGFENAIAFLLQIVPEHGHNCRLILNH